MTPSPSVRGGGGGEVHESPNNSGLATRVYCSKGRSKRIGGSTRLALICLSEILMRTSGGAVHSLVRCWSLLGRTRIAPGSDLARFRLGFGSLSRRERYGKLGQDRLHAGERMPSESS
jgi:hypothetical protein